MYTPFLPDRPSRLRACLFLAGLPLLANLAPAGAETAVVPTDFPTVQAAIEAVQGTAGALVRIDSSATFAESVAVTESITIEGGVGYAPTLYSVDGDFAIAGARSLTLRNLTVVPPPASGPAILIHNDRANLTVVLERVTADTAAVLDAGGLNASSGVGAETRIDVSDSLFRVAGPHAAVAATNSAAVTIARSVFEVRSGATAIEAQAREATIADCRFLLQADGGDVTGLLLRAAVAPGGASFHVERNEIVGLNEGWAQGILLFPGEISSSIVTDNVLRGLARGIVISETSAVTAVVRLLNNTIDGTAGDAVALSASGGSTVEVGLTNNLLTRSGGWAVSSQVKGSDLRIRSSDNGFFANALGNVAPPYSSNNDLLDDPRYVSTTDLRLRGGSPALDRGVDGAGELRPTDRRGQPRIENGKVDLGAYEGSV